MARPSRKEEAIMWLKSLVVITTLAAGGLVTQPPELAPRALPAVAATKLVESLDAARRHSQHAWRDALPRNADDTVNAYIEISRGDRRKWELDMRANARAVDRVIPESIGGFPVNYGFVPQTVSYDGDPLDALVLGSPIDGGATVRGIVVGLMYMEDEKGLDSKVVLSPADARGQPLHELSASERERIAAFFAHYKAHDAGAYSKVTGWGSVAEAASLVARTHAFFLVCRDHLDQPCLIVG